MILNIASYFSTFLDIQYEITFGCNALHKRQKYHNPKCPFLSVFIYMCVFMIFVIMSYSHSLENVLEQIETAESNLNKNLIGIIFKISNLKRYESKLL